MSEPARKKAAYEDLYDVPDNMIGEIIDGELIVTPRPSRRHTLAASRLSAGLISFYDFGRGGGPGGWIIIVEPEIQLGKHTMVPDLAGWKVERFPIKEDHNWISVVPDWICEILSPWTAGLDKAEKMPIYARHEVAHAWLLDPGHKTLDVYKLKSGGWYLAESYGERNRIVRAEPFSELVIDLTEIWLQEA